MEPELRAGAEDLARERGWKLSPYLAWAVRQVVRLDFLSERNREFVLGIAHELGAPWGPLEVINVLIATIRRETAAGRMRLMFWIGQALNGRKA